MSQMKITDISCMLGSWPTRLRYFRNASELYSELDSYRITDCVAYHSMAMWNTMPGNACMRKVAGNSSGRIMPCYVLNPNLGSSEMPEGDLLLQKLKTEKPAAVKLFPQTKGYSLGPFYSGELLEVLDASGLPVLLDSNEVVFDRLPDVANSYPNIKFVILRHGFNDSRYLVPLIKKLKNVYFDTSIMIDTCLIEEIVRKFGSEKLLFSSGMPFYVPAGALSMVLYARIKDSDKENILSGNWARIGGKI